ncbi:MAG: D-2-hydroxyacid dehydrogenase [Thermomicrobiales bacterium]|nr:D-2-hydroxyacid dehydrogenase [Thermomicrobiales bacterium]
MPDTESDRKVLNVLIIMGISSDALHNLRLRFPDARFVVPGEEIDGDGRYRIAEVAPSEAALAEAEVVVGWQISPEQLEQAPRLRWFHAGSAGVEHLDLHALRQRQVVLTNSRGVSAPNIAEHVLGMMVALARRFPRLMREQANHSWRDDDTHREVRELGNETVLILGTGEIGSQVASRAAAFGMRVEGLRRRAAPELPPSFSRIWTREELGEALSGADHVVVTLPDTPGTRSLLDAAAFAACKPGAMIYNVGRGAVIDTAALVAALQSGHLGGAGLDVTEPEPLPADSPLWDLENVLITAHTSGASPRYWERQEAIISDNIARYLDGRTLRNLVDYEHAY